MCDDERAIEVGGTDIGLLKAPEICIFELIVDDDDTIGSQDEQARVLEVAEYVGVEDGFA